MNRSRDIGTLFTSDVIRYLRANGFPHAELRNQAGAFDKGDIVGCLGVAWECKGGHAAETASDQQVVKWLRETEKERRHAEADVGVLVMKRKGLGLQSAAGWWAVMPLWALDSDAADKRPTAWLPLRLRLCDAVTLLRHQGYGTPPGGTP